MTQRLWTREELIIVFNLYCRIPFKASSKNHPDVIKIANLIGRSPSAVNMKIGNFGSFDENLNKKGIVGLTNVSKLDKEIFNEFSGNWDKLVYESELLIKKLSKTTFDSSTEILPKGGEISSVVKTRINQDFFRRTILTSYASTCCITGICAPQLLIASHIKPWKNSSETEKTNPRNGLCLNALHDKAFDQGLITILPDYRITVSQYLKDVYDGDAIQRYFRVYENKQIFLPEKFIPDKIYLEYHNDTIFQR